MAHGINAAVAASVPRCAEKVDAAVYYMAVRCQSYGEAYELLLKIEHLLPIQLVKPWERREHNQQKVIATTSQYTQGGTNPADYGHRGTEASRSVDEFDASAYKPGRGKISPKEAPPSSIPIEHVCSVCGQDKRITMGVRFSHDNCGELRADTSSIKAKAGMSKQKHKKPLE